MSSKLKATGCVHWDVQLPLMVMRCLMVMGQKLFLKLPKIKATFDDILDLAFYSTKIRRRSSLISVPDDGFPCDWT